MDKFSAGAIASRDSEEKFNKFVKDNERFIKKCAAKSCRRFVREEDDEWSVALVAFYEAVRTYDEGKGRFSSFAQLVISRRLKDYFDSESRHRMEIATSPETFDGDIDPEEASAYEKEVAKTAAADAVFSEVDNPVAHEIFALRDVLKKYDFEIFDIGKASPKAGKTKRACAAALRCILEDKELAGQIQEKGTLPYSRLLEVEGVTKKILERHRKYLIVAVLVLGGDYPNLSEYMRGIFAEL